MAALPLSPQVFTILSTLVEEKVGLHYGPDDRELLAEKVSARAREAGFETLLDYYYFLRYDDPEGTELRALTTVLVVGETYFFREFEQLQLIANELVPAALAKKGRVRIWSAACATGEEPLSLAMLLDERGLLDRVTLVASDVNERALARARSGRFSRRSVRTVPDGAPADRYLRVGENEVTIDPALAQAVEWRHVNLLDAAAVAALGTFDVILCRNVLIYFRDETAREAVMRLGAALGPGGALFVGISESLLRFGTSLACEERGGVFLYRKAG